MIAADATIIRTLSSRLFSRGLFQHRLPPHFYAYFCFSSLIREPPPFSLDTFRHFRGHAEAEIRRFSHIDEMLSPRDVSIAARAD